MECQRYRYARRRSYGIRQRVVDTADRIQRNDISTVIRISTLIQTHTRTFTRCIEIDGNFKTARRGLHEKPCGVPAAIAVVTLPRYIRAYRKGVTVRSRGIRPRKHAVLCASRKCKHLVRLILGNVFVIGKADTVERKRSQIPVFAHRNGRLENVLIARHEQTVITLGRFYRKRLIRFVHLCINRAQADGYVCADFFERTERITARHTFHVGKQRKRYLNRHVFRYVLKCKRAVLRKIVNRLAAVHQDRGNERILRRRNRKREIVAVQHLVPDDHLAVAVFRDGNAVERAVDRRFYRIVILGIRPIIVCRLT